MLVLMNNMLEILQRYALDSEEHASTAEAGIETGS